MLKEIYPEYEIQFLEETARSWGWRATDLLIFVERMRIDNKGKSNENLNTRHDLAFNTVATTLCRRVYPKAKSLGCKENGWGVVQEWLQETVFSEWVKPKLWEKLWIKAEPTNRIKIKAEKIGIATAGSVFRDEDKILIPEIPLGSNVNYEVSETADRHVILLERDGEGGICCLSPSLVFPRFKVGAPALRSGLLAVIFAQKPELSWLEKARAGLVELNAAELQELMVWKEGQPDCDLWQREFDIVDQTALN
jgi:hypothetical protein